MARMAATRDRYGEVLLELGAESTDVVVIGGDLTTGEAILVDGGSHLNASGVRR